MANTEQDSLKPSTANHMLSAATLGVLADAILRGEQGKNAIAVLLRRVLGRRWPWIEPLGDRYAERYAGQIRPRLRDVIGFLRSDQGLIAACKKHGSVIRIERRIIGAQPMLPVAAAQGWDIPPIETLGALAEKLGVTPTELGWFADLRALGYKRMEPLLHHYHYRVLIKSSGGISLAGPGQAERSVGQPRILLAHSEAIWAPAPAALANLCSYRLDCRLSGLARKAGAQYTRYADDLAFSGDGRFEHSVEPFATRVAAILAEEGFSLHHRKTRIMRQSVRQHLPGLVVNERLNVRRNEFDTLKAILTNCVRHGAQSQNREGRPDFRQHLQGRISFIESTNAVRGKHLRAIFDRIDRQ